MIVTANENYINVIMNLSAEDPFACRIISQYNSYDSSLAFVDYWTIIDDKTDECTGAISRCGTNFILFLTDKTNLEEVSSFMRVAGQVQYAAEISTLIYTAVNPFRVLF